MICGSLNDRRPISNDDDVVILILPDHESLSAVENIADILAGDDDTPVRLSMRCISCWSYWAMWLSLEYSFYLAFIWNTSEQSRRVYNRKFIGRTYVDFDNLIVYTLSWKYFKLNYSGLGQARPMIMWNPRLISGDVGIGLNVRRLRERLLKWVPISLFLLSNIIVVLFWTTQMSLELSRCRQCEMAALFEHSEMLKYSFIMCIA